MISMESQEFDEPIRQEIIHCKQRLFETDYPRNAKKEYNTYKHRQKQTYIPGSTSLSFRQLVGYNRDENDIVNTEDNF
jgi:hypothetical protein